MKILKLGEFARGWLWVHMGYIGCNGEVCNWWHHGVVDTAYFIVPTIPENGVTFWSKVGKWKF